MSFPRLFRMGCPLGSRVVRYGAPRDGLVVLDFGRPMHVRHDFGASLERAWRQLSKALDSNPHTARPLRWATDITRRN